MTITMSDTDNAFYDGVILGLQVMNAAGDCGDTSYVELLNSAGLDQVVKRARAEGMMRLSGLDKHMRYLTRQAKVWAT